MQPVQQWTCLYKEGKKKHNVRFGATSEGDALRYVINTYKVTPEDVLTLECIGTPAAVRKNQN